MQVIIQTLLLFGLHTCKASVHADSWLGNTCMWTVRDAERSVMLKHKSVSGQRRGASISLYKSL